MATTKAKKEEPVFFTTEDGRKIELRRIDPVFLHAVISSVKMPDVPTYEAKTHSGRIEVHKMDKVSAEQTEGGKEIWETYQEELTKATNEQTNVSLRAIFLEGTVRPEGEFLDLGWERRMKIIGVRLPTDPDELWVAYLSMSLTAQDIIGMQSMIMRLTGVSEEAIQEAEESFRDSAQTDTEESE